jgi:hypothetical protein
MSVIFLVVIALAGTCLSYVVNQAAHKYVLRRPRRPMRSLLYAAALWWSVAVLLGIVEWTRSFWAVVVPAAVLAFLGSEARLVMRLRKVRKNTSRM